jgi:predicted AlkP superfamily pyrophosphatase or phosphodiesterase
MNKHLILLSIPGLRSQDVSSMPNLRQLMAGGEATTMVPSFPCVTWPVQTNIVTGQPPSRHGVIANGFYWREEQQVEMWTAWNEKIQAPQIWDVLHERGADLTSAVWFPMLSKGSNADFVCMPAPVHNPDGSESLWCYSKPQQLYGDLRDELGHFPLQNFWGPLANVTASSWIADSAVIAARRYRPRFFYIYLPHLDYAAQRSGPDSEPAQAALGELDTVIGRLADGLRAALDGEQVVFAALGEYVITPVDHVAYPNRALREAGLLQVREQEDGEHLDFAASDAWALVDHQLAHVFVKDRAAGTIQRVMELFQAAEGIEEVLMGVERGRYHLNHDRSGDVILVSSPNSWQAYYWWFDDGRAPAFARTVDIHRKPGYDPVELCFDPATKSIPLDATRIRGSHGVPATDATRHGAFLASEAGILGPHPIVDTEVIRVILRYFEM